VIWESLYPILGQIRPHGLGRGAATTIGCKRSKFMIKEIRFCLNADAAPSLLGAYAMAIELADEVAVTLSGRSPITLSAGRYLYCGSAKGPGG
jgi:hypothetical protein